MAHTDQPTRFNVACCDREHCWARPCMHPGLDKGSFTPGKGYTSYRSKPLLVCTTRQFHGCPHPLPEPDPETARCCYHPDYRYARRDRKAVPCHTCGNTASGKAAKVLNTLPTLPGVPCQHQRQMPGRLIDGWIECEDCRGHWQDRNHVKPFEPPTHTFQEMLDVLCARIRGVEEEAEEESRQGGEGGGESWGGLRGR